MAPAQSTTVLIVDDEPAIRLLCRVNLELDGYVVLEASSVAAARQILASDKVDVLLVDVHIGDADGRDLVHDLAGREPRPRCALITGSVQLSPADRGGADEVIEKPFSLDTLAAVVARLAERDVDSSMT